MHYIARKVKFPNHKFTPLVAFISMEVHLGVQTELEPRFPAPQPAALSVVFPSLKIRKINIPCIEYRMFSI